jgi:hypothetical protein
MQNILYVLLCNLIQEHLRACGCALTLNEPNILLMERVDDKSLVLIKFSCKALQGDVGLFHTK